MSDPILINGNRTITTLGGQGQITVPNCVMIPTTLKSAISDPLNFTGKHTVHYGALDTQTGEVLSASGSPAEIEIQSIPSEMLFNGVAYSEFLEVYKEVVKYIVSEHLKPVPEVIPAPIPEGE
jgi:hypothetical protein